MIEDCSFRTSLLVFVGTWLNGVAVGIVLMPSFRRWMR